MRPTAARESPRRCRARAPPSRRHAGVGSTSRCPPVLSLPRHDGRSDDGRPDDGRSDDGRPDDGRTALDRTRRRAHGPTAARAAPRRPGLHHDRSSNPADLAVGCVTSRPIGPRRTTDAQRPADPPTRRPADPPTRRPADPPTRRPADPPTRRKQRIGAESLRVNENPPEFDEFDHFLQESLHAQRWFGRSGGPPSCPGRDEALSTPSETATRGLVSDSPKANGSAQEVE